MKPWNKLLCKLRGHSRRKCDSTTATHRLMKCPRCGDIEHRAARPPIDRKLEGGAK